MFYKQFSNITDVLSEDIVTEYDYWLATLPERTKKNIVVSVVASTLNITYPVAKSLIEFSVECGIMERHYLLICPDCNAVLQSIKADEDIANFLIEKQLCNSCGENKWVSTEDIFECYDVIKEPDASYDEIQEEIKKRITNANPKINFAKADSLFYIEPECLYKQFYNPDESAYQLFSKLRKKLDWDYGDDTTAKGKSLENLACAIFNEIKGIGATTKIKTNTNQFDCTCLSHISLSVPTVYRYFSDYFIIECKNEKNKPNNTYTNKLESILTTTEAKLGIIWGRVDATSTCKTISREFYLKNNQIIITFCDNDLDKIIKQRVNLLSYIQFKINQITLKPTNAKYEALPYYK